ncbi:AAA family ATPase [Candidatus Gracilibacteria bacterium]|nr:AAA family ATPase [Candidatus Gracilibacteria bacterium]
MSIYVNLNELTIKNIETEEKTRIWIFTKNIEKNNYLKISIGYFLTEKNKIDYEKRYRAFCFFQTSEETNMPFILHAPFLLTNNRGNIKIDNEINKKLITELAKLYAQSFLILRDIGIKYNNYLIDEYFINLIPYYTNNIRNNSQISFEHFYKEIKELFQNEKIIPSRDNTYLKKCDTYWFSDKNLFDLLSNSHIRTLTKNDNSGFINIRFGRNSLNPNDPKREFIGSICNEKVFDPYYFISLITSEFIEKQPIEWLIQLYEYLNNTSLEFNDLKFIPFIINQQYKATAPYDKNNNNNRLIYLTTRESKFNTIHPEIIENNSILSFLKVKIGICEPNLLDNFKNNILHKYIKSSNELTDKERLLDFKYILKIYKNCTYDEKKDIIKLLIGNNTDVCKFFAAFHISSKNELVFENIKKIYYENEELKIYTKYNSDMFFINAKYYEENLDVEEREVLQSLLKDLNVTELPNLFEKLLPNIYLYKYKEKYHKIENIEYFKKYNSERHIYNYEMHGLNNIIDIITGNNENDKEEKLKLSSCIWNLLLKLIEKYKSCNCFMALYKYYPPLTHNITETYCESDISIILKNKKWLFNSDNDSVSPHQITLKRLNSIYDTNSIASRLLIDFLQFKSVEYPNLTDEQNNILGILENAKQQGITVKEIEVYINNKNSIKLPINNTNSETPINDNENIKKTIKSRIGTIIKDLDDLQTEFASEGSNSETDIKNDFNENEEFAKGIENLKKQFEIKNNRDVLIKEMENYEKSEKRYSYEWFIAYLKLLNTYSEKQDAAKQKSLTFKEIKPYKTDNKYFLLCGASSYISSEIENAQDFKITLVFKDGKKENITVEGVSKKGLDLLIYIPNESESKKISNFKSIFKVEINFTPVIDLLERLLNAFKNTENIDKWKNIEKDMPALNYIYGPPGTGKTTAICYFIKDILDNNPNAKFLVLTPTNKAADVVCKKLWEINYKISTARLSHPTDPDLEEKSNIYKDTLTNEILNEIDVVATTIHRLPYYVIQNSGLLFKYKWDYVIFDESSMIGLHYITFAIMALQKTNSNIHFTIAGDPKQIPPIVEINDNELENFDFQDENIYKMMELESFDPDEQKIRKNIDAILNLKKQYRSIPEIGQLFSELSYKGLLEHDREDNRKESKPLPAKFKEIISSNVTFIDIPLEQDNSIYKVSKLFYSSYQTYCAILVLEIIKFFDKENNSKQDWTIGIIAPYKAQAVLMNKLITSYGISENVKVFSDTVHGFQGDECDIVFFICNPNNYKFSNHPKCLLSKEYIYNVAISRAKDYLVIFHPQSKTYDNTFINTIHHSYKKNFGNSSFLETKVIENVLFNDEKYIEKNSYVSGHDNVNVFGLSEMKYFIKLNDTAIDIQLIDLKEHKTI